MAELSIYPLDLEKQTLANEDYRKVVATTDQLQVVLMSIPVDGYIKLERHSHTSQFIRIESGTGTALINIPVCRQKGICHEEHHTVNLYAGAAVIIPAGAWHKINNVGSEPLKLYTIYAPPEHPPGLVQATQPLE